MVRNRTGLAPWSLSREAGIESATVDGTIEVPQYVQPVLDTGFVDEKGDWKGAKSNDKDFIAFHTDVGIANTGTFLTPDVNSDGTWPLDMTGYADIQIAIKATAGGNYKIEAVMGPDSLSYANLNPVDAAASLRICTGSNAVLSGDTNMIFSGGFSDAVEILTVDVWNIFMIQGRLANQKLLQFKLTNNTGGISTIETAFMRIV
jgi:hypothetical protein